MDKTQLIENIVEKEWRQFTQVNNQGGRAACQDDRVTFDIMRKSQFMTWTDDLLKSYANDLAEAEAKGWSLLAEKYARMMISTAPKEYELLKDQLPFRSQERQQKEQSLVAMQVDWLEKVYRQYPRLAQSGRPVHSWQDTPWATSFETYQRGELGTYSDRTLELYENMLRSIREQGGNLAEMTLENTARFYGYGGLEDLK